jgi:hypothetical protein
MDPGSLEPVMRRLCADRPAHLAGTAQHATAFQSRIARRSHCRLKPMEGCGEQGEEATEAQGKWNISFKFLVRERRRVER